MRFVLSGVPLILRFGQAGGVIALGLFAMAAAPLGAAAVPPENEVGAPPVAAPIQAVARPAGPVTGKMAFQAPLKGYRVNSPFGLRKLSIETRARQHKGVDIAAPTGTAVYSTARGRVVRTGYQAGGYGNFIEIKHPNGMSSLYAHLSKIEVRPGQTVRPEWIIGRVGSTGHSTGPHLHFEMKSNGVQVNPARLVGTEVEVKLNADGLRRA